MPTQFNNNSTNYYYCYGKSFNEIKKCYQADSTKKWYDNLPTEESEYDDSENWYGGLAIPFDDEYSEMGTAVEVLIGRIRSDWNQEMSRGEISAYEPMHGSEPSAQYIFIDIYDKNKVGPPEKVVFFCTEDGRQYIEIERTTYMVLHQDAADKAALDGLDPAHSLINRWLLFSGLVDKPERSVYLAAIITDPVGRSIDLTADHDSYNSGINHIGHWTFQIGAGDQMYDIEEDRVINSTLFDIVNSEFISCLIESCGISREGGELCDSRDEENWVVGLLTN